MNREIKFRAWDNNTKIMIYPGDIAGWLNQTPLSNGDLINWFEDETLMQYTGQKDSNDKEIYEGDIIKVSLTDNAGQVIVPETVGTVEYKATKLHGTPGFYGVRSEEGAMFSRVWFEINMVGSQGTIEVIGNIYESLAT